METETNPPESAARSGAQFATTHWSTVLAAGESASVESSAALERLCQTYWYPLYAFVRRKGHPPEDAQDLTQAFFERFIEKRFPAARSILPRGRAVALRRETLGEAQGGHPRVAP